MGAWDSPPTEDEQKAAGVFDAPPTPEELAGAQGVKPSEPPKSTSAASKALSAGYGAQDTATFGNGDELTGALGALMSYLPGLHEGGWGALAKGAEGKSLADRYRWLREGARAEDRQAKAANPGYYLGGQIAGAVAPAVATLGTSSGAQGAGLGARLLAASGRGALEGGAYGLGSSEADLTQGDMAGAAKDTATGAALGVGLGAGAAGLGAGLRGAARWAERGIGDALDKATANATKEVGERLQSLTGALGGEAQKASRYIENLMRLRERATPGEQEAIDAFLGSENGKAIVDSVLKNTLEAAPGQAARVAAKRGELEAAREGAGDALARATEEGVSPTRAWEQIKARLWRYGPPALGSAIGGAIGGPVGVGIGALSGAGTRPMVQALRRMGKDPAVATAFYKAVRGTAQFPENLAEGLGLSPGEASVLVQALRERPALAPVYADEGMLAKQGE